MKRIVSEIIETAKFFKDIVLNFFFPKNNIAVLPSLDYSVDEFNIKATKMWLPLWKGKMFCSLSTDESTAIKNCWKHWEKHQKKRRNIIYEAWENNK